MNDPSSKDVVRLLADAALKVTSACRLAVSSLTLEQRAFGRAPSVLKPGGGDAAMPDVSGEIAAFAILENLSRQLRGCEIRVIVDDASFHSLRSDGDELSASWPRNLHVWCYLDPVDGTVKVAGLNNEGGRMRLGNDGGWGSGVAFTLPTEMEQKQLRLGDFQVRSICLSSRSSSALHCS